MSLTSFYFFNTSSIILPEVPLGASIFNKLEMVGAMSIILYIFFDTPFLIPFP